MRGGGAGGWQPAWIPVFEDGGSYLCVDSGEADGAVRAFRPGQAEQPVVAPSLEAWLHDFVSAAEAVQQR